LWLLLLLLLVVVVVVVVVGPTGIRPLKLDVAAESFKTITLIAFLDCRTSQV